MKVVITGANGYIATQVAKYFSANGHSAIGMVREGSEINNPEFFEGTVFNGDLFGSVYDALSDAKAMGAQAVIHLAAHYTTKADWPSSSQLLNDNVLLSSYIMSACSELYLPFWGTSTFSMFNEFHEYSPRSFYDETKRAMEKLAHTYALSGGILRLSDTYGPDDYRPKAHNLLNDNKINSLWVKPEQKINFTHTEDIARAFEIVVSDSIGNDEFKVYETYEPSQEITMGDLVRILNSSAVFTCEVEPVGIPPLKHKIPNYSPVHDVKDMKKVLDGGK